MDLLYKNKISEELANQLSSMIPKMDKLDSFLFVDGSWNKCKKDVSGFGFIAIIPISEEIYRIYLGSGSTNDDFNTLLFDGENFASMRNVFGEVASTMYGVIKICNDFDIHHLQEPGSACRKINIFYDYEGIRKWVTKEWQSKNKLTKKYHNMMYELSFRIIFKFFKINAHSGVIINEIADKLAKNGISLDGIKLFKDDIKIDIDRSDEKYKEYVLASISKGIIDIFMKYIL